MSKQKSDAQNQTRKKRQAEQGDHGHKNKYAEFSHADEAQKEIDNLSLMTTRKCPKCQEDIQLEKWKKHDCKSTVR